MNKKYCFISIVLSIVLSLCFACVEVQAATVHTVDEALAWVKSLEGVAYDYDGAYGAQCVDLVKGYYAYLGVQPVGGNGCDYATNALPYGWQRIKDGVPQKGDILIYSGNTNNQYGHVAIYESEKTMWHGRFAGNGKVQKTTKVAYNGLSNPYWGLIRPDWGNTPNDGSRVINTGVTDITDTTAKINATVSPRGTVTEAGFYLGTSPDNMQKHIEATTTVNCASIFYTLGNGKWTSALSKGTTYYYQIYGIIDGITYKSSIDSFTTTGDNTKPVISSAYITDLSANGYTAVCNATDNVGVSRVSFPTWTLANGQDDLVSDWYNNATATNISGNTYTFRVNISDHNYERGQYATHIYVYDMSGNYVMTELLVEVPQPVIYVTGVVLNKSALTLNINETSTLTATVSPSNASNRSVTWSSSNTSVATVSSSGVVTAVGKGTATITATAKDGSGVSGSCTVTVNKPTQSVVVVFDDIKASDWWVEAVQFVYDNGIMAGKNESFDPTGKLTREQFVQVLYNHSGTPAVTIENKFPDVKSGQWYYNAVLWANANDIANGRGDGTFGVGKNISRQDLALMLYKYARLNGYDIAFNEGEIEKYADDTMVSGYAKEAMNWAVTQGIMSGKGKVGEDISTFRLDPLGTATRAECASMMMKLIQKNDALN